MRCGSAGVEESLPLQIFPALSTNWIVKFGRLVVLDALPEKLFTRKPLVSVAIIEKLAVPVVADALPFIILWDGLTRYAPAFGVQDPAGVGVAVAPVLVAVGVAVAVAVAVGVGPVEVAVGVAVAVLVAVLVAS